MHVQAFDGRDQGQSPSTVSTWCIYGAAASNEQTARPGVLSDEPAEIRGTVKDSLPIGHPGRIESCCRPRCGRMQVGEVQLDRQLRPAPDPPRVLSRRRRGAGLPGAAASADRLSPWSA